MITYLATSGNEILVKLDGKVVGLIRSTKEGFHYQVGTGLKPKYRGETFKTVAEVKRSLEAE